MSGDDPVDLPQSPELHLTFLGARQCVGHWHVRFHVTDYFEGQGRDVIAIKALGTDEAMAVRLAECYAQASRDEIRKGIIAKYN